MPDARPVVKVLLAARHPVVQRGLKEIVTDVWPFLTVALARDGFETLDLIRKQTWNLVVLDVAIHGGHGLEVLKDIKRERPNLPVVVLSLHAEEQFAVRAMRAGASAYLMHDTAADDIVAAVRSALGGRKYVTRSVAEQLAVAVDAGAREVPHEALSDREYSVFRMIAAGVSVREIAAELSLSVKTISTYRTRILIKLGVRTNAELMRYAIRRGLVT